MRKRSLAAAIEAFAFADRRIAMVSGPRQCGKTTMARMMLARRKAGSYGNWDQYEFRRAWARNPASVVPRPAGKAAPLVVLDEIHKDRLWKRNLKGLFDALQSPCDFLVTGSARLNVYRRGGDSLLGRYVHFRMHPFSVREMARTEVPRPDEAVESLFSRAESRRSSAEAGVAALMAFGPFPFPLLAGDTRKARLWRRNRESLVVREDLRDLSRLPDLGRIEMMTALLAERVGSPFSTASLARDLEVSFPTIRRWVNYLKELFYLFEVKPYARGIARSLRSEGKLYLWDYGAVKSEAARFENLVASHLVTTSHVWTATGEGDFDLFYLRDKEKREIDFLVTRDGDPWLPVEVKLSDETPSPSWRRFAGLLPCKRGLQVVRRPAWRLHEFGAGSVLVAGAAEALSYLA